MKLQVRYCPTWDGYDKAAQAVHFEVMKSIFDKDLSRSISVAIKEGDKGEFTISLDDDIIFDKSETDRFPEDKEIVKLLKKV